MKLQLLDRLFIVKNNSHYLMFNPYNNAMLKIDEPTMERVKKSEFSAEERDTLLGLDMVRPQNVPEDIYFQRWLNNSKYNTRGHRNYILVLTGKCNFNIPFWNIPG